MLHEGEQSVVKSSVVGSGAAQTSGGGESPGS